METDDRQVEKHQNCRGRPRRRHHCRGRGRTRGTSAKRPRTARPCPALQNRRSPPSRPASPLRFAKISSRCGGYRPCRSRRRAGRPQRWHWARRSAACRLAAMSWWTPIERQSRPLPTPASCSPAPAPSPPRTTRTTPTTPSSSPSSSASSGRRRCRRRRGRARHGERRGPQARASLRRPQPGRRRPPPPTSSPSLPRPPPDRWPTHPAPSEVGPAPAF
mmetsp:Transcript_87396/g.250513  ORF Transcript_87396/g.250513 Transcript_87396/m.250513 type:complete len:219 (-) Transcript_87396:537-1193(-)